MKRSLATCLLVVIATLIPSLVGASVLIDPVYVGTLISTGDPVYVGTLTSDGAVTNPVALIIGTPNPSTTIYDTTTPQSPVTSPSTYGFVTQPTDPASYSAYVVVASTEIAPLDNGLSIQLGTAVPTATYTAGAGSVSPSLYDTSLSGANLM